MALHKDMQKLILTIREPIIFFLPRNILEEVMNKDFGKLEALGLLNTLFITNAAGETKPFFNNTELLQILNKEKLLKSNIFELLDLRTKLDKSAFNYLIDDYFKELSTWINTTEIVEREAKIHVINYNAEVQVYLKLQNQVLLNHQAELKSHFGDGKSWFEVERVFKDSLYDINKDDNKEEISELKPSIVRKGKADILKTKKKKSRFLVIKEAEVDQYLLETVFNVNLSEIKNSK
ncbi:hypothetical protein [Winogradskyella thalassocola]|uniref:Uncharacterized protein n=1 Tax=Winogradskyella thalassocola TaxID=262004 RepID=A0A1G7ZPG6_9FLAO|nr:hypothetical protein [Winogradskyella thalassocola]SDH10641.1 hypothetical protein SAMN04489796_1011400 [Winogradskyella thalassocola]